MWPVVVVFGAQKARATAGTQPLALSYVRRQSKQLITGPPCPESGAPRPGEVVHTKGGASPRFPVNGLAWD
jgi:hypothetical protein